MRESERWLSVVVATLIALLILVPIHFQKVQKSIPSVQSQAISDKEEAGLKRGASRIIVWGKVTYVDTFKFPHITRYAFSLRWEGDKFGLPFYEPGGNTSD
jgi:uncharacterized membrane protein